MFHYYLHYICVLVKLSYNQVLNSLCSKESVLGSMRVVIFLFIFLFKLHIEIQVWCQER